ncbi:MAG: molybdate ABC transporter substrate-binding protein [Opitutaceae bacterium]|nr:molybdate ABC transporter substrate-binding protein [Opitutaceae bacterium]
MKRLLPGSRLAGLALAGALCWPRLAATEIDVFAAASLSDALRDLATLHEKATGDTVRLNLGASSTLARQIKGGAPADLFFSADEAKMDDLARAGLIDPATRCSLLSNSLVIVVAVDCALQLTSVRDLAQSLVRRLAVAEPQTVPAGIYARKYLQQEGLWELVAGKTVPVENVRAVLAAVESGNVDAGIVYRTDALISRKVRIALEIPSVKGPPISYPLALIKGSRNSAAAARFFALLTSPTGKSVFVRYGFLTEP